jgi:regulator of sirC expression with transglutaminase-like and TPR domain
MPNHLPFFQKSSYLEFLAGILHALQWLIGSSERQQNATWLRCSLALLLVLFATGYSQAQTPDRHYHAQTIWQLPGMAEDGIDVGLWALIIAKEFDPTVDVARYSNQLDSFILEIRRMLANRTSDRDKFAAIRMFLYEAGIWNDQRPFQYDLDDPLGTDLSQQLLSSYLQSRKRNCVSMPTLFCALMQRLDPLLPVSAVHAPLHLFCRIKDRQTNDIWNVETTNGTTARNVWYIESMNIPKKEIEHGIYMRELSKKEFLAELISILVHQQRDKQDFRKALRYVDLALKLNPRSITNIVQKCALNAEIGFPIYEKQKRGDRLTAVESQRLDKYISVSKRYDALARSLGWRPETPEQRAQYLENVKEEKEKQSPR